jgi:hypothetical protein
MVMPEPGNQIGRYRLEQVLGQGGFATVYRAYDPELGRSVAIKLLHPHLVASRAFVRRFRAEARAMARLRHPHIVPIYDVGETADGRSYLVMAFLEGMTLAQAIARDAPFAEQRGLAILTQLADALDYLHRQGFVHRDVKPANIMLHADDTITLMDFGIARTLDDQALLTQSGELVGTVAYMAPEQIAGGPVSPATDLYSFGLVAYELFAGRPPFRGSASEVLDQQRTQPPPPLTAFNPTISPAIAAGIAACLAKDPTHRPPSAHAAVALLMGGAATETVARPRPAQRRFGAALPRRPLLAALAAALVLGGGAAALALKLHPHHTTLVTRKSIPPPAGTAAPTATEPCTTFAPPTSVASTANGSAAAGDVVMVADSLTRDCGGILPTAPLDPAHFAEGYTNGSYRLATVDPNERDAAFALISGPFADATIAVDARLVGTTIGRTVQVDCRVQFGPQGTSKYQLQIETTNGQFVLAREDQGHYVSLVGPQTTTAILHGTATNRLELSCIGKRITARINGVQVATIEDATYATGQFGLEAGVLPTFLPGTVEARFNNLVISVPRTPAAATPGLTAAPAERRASPASGAGATFTLLGFAPDTGPANTPPPDLVPPGGSLHGCQPPGLYAFVRFAGLREPTTLAGDWALNGQELLSTTFKETLNGGVMFWSLAPPLPPGDYQLVVRVGDNEVARGTVRLLCP